MARSRFRARRMCRMMAKEAPSNVRKARIEMASKACMQLAKDSKAGSQSVGFEVSDVRGTSYGRFRCRGRYRRVWFIHIE